MVIGITGGSGSGKSSLMRALQRALPDSVVDVLVQDDYYHPITKQVKDPKGKVNFDLPTALDLDAFAADIRKLKQGRPVHVKEYTFNERTRVPKERMVKPKPVILTEGLFLLCNPTVRNELDHTVFVETDHTEQLRRRLDRDEKERGYTREMIMYQWEYHVQPAYEQFLLPHRMSCDLVIKNNNDLYESVNELLDYAAMRIGLPVLDSHLL
jgi:uridine kinase